MNFDSLSYSEKKSVLRKLGELSECLLKMQSHNRELDEKIKELEKKAETSSVGCFLWVFIIFFIGSFMLSIYSSVKSDSTISSIYKENPVLFVVVAFVVLFVIALIIWLIMSKFTGYSEGKKAKKQLVVLKERQSRNISREKSISAEMSVICNKYSLPIDKVASNDFKYIRKIIENRQCGFREAISFFENEDRRKYVSLEESLRPFLRNTQKEQTNDSSLLERYIKYKIKGLGFLFGITKDTFENAKRSSNIPYSQSSDEFNNMETGNSFESDKYTFIDGNGNYCESRGTFYDGKGFLRNWGDDFYDGRGNYVEWGDPFYDGKGNYCEFGQPFYDWKGNLINPKF